VLLLQQPLGQDAALHTHAPVAVSHAWPVGHAAHVAPPAPHEVFDSLASGSHTDPLPQQPAQVPPPQEHWPLAQLSPLPHGLHVLPPVPHWLEDCEA
jgi:hypothetical protein